MGPWTKARTAPPRAILPSNIFKWLYLYLLCHPRPSCGRQLCLFENNEPKYDKVMRSNTVSGINIWYEEYKDCFKMYDVQTKEMHQWCSHVCIWVSTLTFATNQKYILQSNMFYFRLFLLDTECTDRMDMPVALTPLGLWWLLPTRWRNKQLQPVHLPELLQRASEDDAALSNRQCVS